MFPEWLFKDLIAASVMEVHNNLLYELSNTDVEEKTELKKNSSHFKAELIQYSQYLNR